MPRAPRERRRSPQPSAPPSGRAYEPTPTPRHQQSRSAIAVQLLTSIRPSRVCISGRHPLVAAKLAQPPRPIGPAHRPFPRGLHLVDLQPTRARREARDAITDEQRAVLDARPGDDRRAQHTDAPAAEEEEGARVRRVRPHQADELLGGPREVELALFWIELRRDRHSGRVLRTPDQLAAQVARPLLLENLAAELREP